MYRPKKKKVNNFLYRLLIGVLRTRETLERDIVFRLTWHQETACTLELLPFIQHELLLLPLAQVVRHLARCVLHKLSS